MKQIATYPSINIMKQIYIYIVINSIAILIHNIHCFVTGAINLNIIIIIYICML